MKLLFVTNNTFTVGGKNGVAKIETDGTYLYVTVAKVPRATVSYGNISLSCTYNGVTKDVSSNLFAGNTAKFTYSNSVKSITLSGGSSVYYNNVGGSSVQISWKGGAGDITPDVEVSFDGIRLGKNFTFSYEYYDMEDYPTYLIGLYANTWSEDDEQWYRLTYQNGKYTDMEIAKSFSTSYSDRTKVEFTLYFACYKNSSDGVEEYIGLYEYVSPVYTVSTNGYPYAPHNLICENAAAGKTALIEWEKVYDVSFTSVTYELQRSVGGGEYATVYTGNGKLYRDTIPSGARSVAYRVRTVSGTKYSPWCEGERIDLSKCNVYVGIDGVVYPATAVYIGRNGVPTITSGEIRVG